MKKITSLLSSVKLFLSKTGNLRGIKNEGYIFRFSFYRRRRVNIILAILCFGILTQGLAQDAGAYYEKGLKENQARHYKKAIQLFDKAALLAPGDNKILIKRGFAKLRLKENESAIIDFTDAINIDSVDKEAWCYRGVARSYIADYTGALADVNKAIMLDAAYGTAYYVRGVVNENLGYNEAACADYNKALQLGEFFLQARVDSCKGTPHRTLENEKTVLLAKEPNKQKLFAIFIEPAVKNEDDSCLMLFMLLQPEMKMPVSDSLNGITIEDSSAFVEINLENSGQVVVKNLRYVQSSVNKQVIALIFSVSFDQRQKELLARHDLEKIMFVYGAEHFEFTIKNKYSGNIKRGLQAQVKEN